MNTNTTNTTNTSNTTSTNVGTNISVNLNAGAIISKLWKNTIKQLDTIFWSVEGSPLHLAKTTIKTIITTTSMFKQYFNDIHNTKEKMRQQTSIENQQYQQELERQQLQARLENTSQQ